MAGEPQLTVDEVVGQLGPLDELRSGLAEFRRNARAFSSKRPQLIEQYRDQWVAALGGEVVAHADSFPEVLAAIDERGIPRTSVLVRFIAENPRTMIL